MTRDGRENILGALRSSPAGDAPEPPVIDPPREAHLDRQGLVRAFCTKCEEETTIVHRQDEHGEESGDLLARIFREQGIEHCVASSDWALTRSGLPEEARRRGISLIEQTEFSGREDFLHSVFHEADAGLTGADFGVAESGTLVLAFRPEHARLISLAPVVHIAVLFKDRIVPTYEHTTAEIFQAGQEPSQAVWITGPSMTADIQGTPFKGMHGPQKLIVLLL